MDLFGTETSIILVKLFTSDTVAYIDRVRLKPPPKNFKKNYLTFLHKFPTIIRVTIPEQKFLVLLKGKNDITFNFLLSIYLG